MTRWLEETYRVRPLGEPYFSQRQVTMQGGRAALDLPRLEPAGPFREALRGEKLLLRAEHAEFHQAHADEHHAPDIPVVE